MIHQSKPIVRRLFVAVLIVSMFLCPLAHGGFVRMSSAEGERQVFPTVAPQDPTIPTPLGTSIPSFIPVPTLGPGSYYVVDDRLPEMIVSHGDNEFGWGQLKDDANLALIWVTKEGQTRYLIIELDNVAFLGHEGLDDGFSDYLMDEETGRIRTLEKIRQSENRSMISGVGGIIACGLIAIGPAGWASAAAVLGVTALLEGGLEIGMQDSLETELLNTELNLLGRFEQLCDEYSNP